MVGGGDVGGAVLGFGCGAGRGGEDADIGGLKRS